MESEHSGIFRVEMVTKNVVLGSPGTHFMHMSVKVVLKLVLLRYFLGFFSILKESLQNLKHFNNDISHYWDYSMVSLKGLLFHPQYS